MKLVRQGGARGAQTAGRRLVPEIRWFDLRGPARRRKGGVQESAEPVPFGPVRDFRKGAGCYEDVKQSVDVSLYNLSRYRACA